MSKVLDNELIQIINDPETVKSVITINKEGIPHSAYKGSLHVTDDGTIQFLELLESSINNANLVYSIWFDKVISIQILSKDKRSFEILGKPIKSITAGSEFEKAYVELQDKRGKEADLAAIWKIEPLSVREETFAVRQLYQREHLPLLRHVDALLK